MEEKDSKRKRVRQSFKIKEMSELVEMSPEKIKEILSNPKADRVRNVQASKLLNNGSLQKYTTLRSAKEACENFSSDSEDYKEAFEVWEWYAFKSVTKACTLSLIVDALGNAPKGTFPETLAVQRIAQQFGYRGKNDLD